MSVSRESQKRAFEFLLKKYQGQEPFTKAEFQRATGWSEGTFKTYWSKQFKGLFIPVGDSHRIHGVFGRYTSWSKFRSDIVTQKRKLVKAYMPCKFNSVILFEFFMPLRNEESLRRALDALFFKDSVIARLRTIETLEREDLRAMFPPSIDESSEQYFSGLCTWTSDKFVGYSIHHVSGRFRVGPLRTRQQVMTSEVQGIERYLVDETTAIVRFIIPCGPEVQDELGHRTQHSEQMILTAALGPSTQSTNDEKIETEANQIRWLFMRLFVQQIIEVVAGEDEIWLLESGIHNQLHIWRAQD